jgi:hypothetical protein
MKIASRLSLALATVISLASLAFAASAAMPEQAQAHRHGCHRWHTCPSDHATYRWGPRRLLCVAPYSDKRNSTFRIRVAWAGRAYWCKR